METEICRPFIERQIELANPKVLMTLGNPSSKLLLQTQTGIMRLRGNWGNHRTPFGLEIATMPGFHPAYLLRNPPTRNLPGGISWKLRQSCAAWAKYSSSRLQTANSRTLK